MTGVVLGLLLWAGTPAAEPGCSGDAAVERAIAQKARELKGDEHCEARGYLHGDLDGDGTDDLVVLFNVAVPRKGGTDVPAFMGVFPSRKTGQPSFASLGEQRVVIVDRVVIERGMIVVATLTRDRQDAACCPSIRTVKAYKLEKSALVDVPSTSEILANAAPRSSQGLSRGQVAAGVRPALEGVKRCYEAELVRRKDLAGKVELSWTITPEGRAERVRVAESTIDESFVRRCVSPALLGLTFPKAREATPVERYPFVFQPADP